MNQTPKNAPKNATPSVVPHPDQDQLRQMIMPIKSPATQVGESIVYALQQDNTVAVITTVVVGPDGGQHVVTAALDPTMMNQVQELLAKASEDREDDERCMGFHCLVRVKGEGDAGPVNVEAGESGSSVDGQKSE